MSSIVQKIDRSRKITDISKNAKIRNFDDYMALPEINRHYEIIDGEIIMPAAPNIRHQLIARNLSYVLHGHVSMNKLGNIIGAPTDICISEFPFRTRQPDVLFITQERGGFTDTDSARGIQLLDVGPELVIEVLSQSDTPKVIRDKLKDYQKIDVDECWLINPDSYTVKVLKLFRDKIEKIGIFGTGDKVQSEVLPELDLSVDEIFA